ncbi:glycerol dehydrogenase [Helicovermis profundi]|uniref:Glycerol dehydrogenase n=1 Tax=Helicovermis profundi TaxID=3065157 RepID=A0AAU9ENG9_9FIRM|nr:glycerol dehydrogenase [Clostridia bacterium S502]
MRKILISPSKYLQGKGELSNLGTYVNDYGKKALLIASKDDRNRVIKYIESALEKEAFEIIYGDFGGECTKNEIEKQRKIFNDNKCEVVIGLGGGKALDTAKAVSHYENKDVIIVPTIASTDAPCSSLAVIYTEKGEFEEYIFFKKNPNLVLVDTEIIANAPTRFLVSGIGDALSTYFEARACEKSFADNIPGGKSTKAAIAIAKLCYETLLEDSLKAKYASDNNVVTMALENIVEANILLSGIGFESSGLAAAHAIHNGLTVMEETHKYFHGEKVAFGVIVQLVLENANKDELNKIIKFNKSLGLPICLKDLGVKKIDSKKIMEVSSLSCADGETIYNMPFEVTKEDVFAAIITANKLGEDYEKNNK